MTHAAESPRFDARRFIFKRGHEVRAAARDEEDVRKTQGAIIRRLEVCKDVPGWKHCNSMCENGFRPLL